MAVAAAIIVVNVAVAAAMIVAIMLSTAALPFRRPSCTTTVPNLFPPFVLIRSKPIKDRASMHWLVKVAAQPRF